MDRNLWFVFLYRIWKIIDSKKLKHSWSNHTITVFMASALLARTKLIQQKHWILVKDLINSYKEPHTQMAKQIKQRMECIYINFPQVLPFSSRCQKF